MKIVRAAEITSILLEEGLGFLTRNTEEPADPEVPEPEVAIRLRRTLQRLGPTFVKFGQMLATRVDLFSQPFIDELSRLHSDVETFPTDQARAIMATELGRPIEDVFAELSAEPVAAASIAQVYRGRLTTGEEVAVKVQRPDIETTLLSDLDTLLVLSGFIDRLVPPYRAAMVHRVAQEYAMRARTEIDFVAEARAVERFADVLSTLPEFRAPALYREHSSPRMLVMEWMQGTKLGDVPGPAELAALGFEPGPFARSMLRLQLSMAYEHGFIHGDTHPGNIILLPTGQIALIDFGLHAQVSRQLREKMLELVFAQASGDLDRAAECYVEVFQPDPDSDIDGFKQAIKQVLKELLEAEGGIGESRITEGMIRGMRAGSKYRMTAQSELFMVVRNLTIVEGIVLRYCPTMDANEEVKNITGAILRRRLFGPSMQEEMLQLLPQLALTLSQRPRLVARLLKLERSFNASANLGEFLRHEDVIGPRPKAPPHPAWFVVVALLGVIVGLLI